MCFLVAISSNGDKNTQYPHNILFTTCTAPTRQWLRKHSINCSDWQMIGYILIEGEEGYSLGWLLWSRQVVHVKDSQKTWGIRKEGQKPRDTVKVTCSGDNPRATRGHCVNGFLQRSRVIGCMLQYDPNNQDSGGNQENQTEVGCGVVLAHAGALHSKDKMQSLHREMAPSYKEIAGLTPDQVLCS